MASRVLNPRRPRPDLAAHGAYLPSFATGGDDNRDRCIHEPRVELRGCYLSRARLKRGIEGAVEIGLLDDRLLQFRLDALALAARNRR